jgi:carboxymethylenebutenolidase
VFGIAYDSLGFSPVALYSFEEFPQFKEVKMKLKVLIGTLAVAVLAGTSFYWAAMKHPQVASATSAVHSTVLTETAAKELLNNTQQHREWVSLQVGSAGVRVFVAYPWRSDRAPSIVVTTKGQSASVWTRGAALQLALEGYIAVVPDLLSGVAPNGGDSDSFASSQAIATALDRMDRNEIARRINAAREYASSLPAANGQTASVELNPTDGRMTALIDAPLAGIRSGSFALDANGWPKAMTFLAVQTNNHPIAGSNPNVPEDHSMHMAMGMNMANMPGMNMEDAGGAHIGMIMAQAPDEGKKKGGRGPAGYPQGKLPDLPAGVFNAHSIVTNSKLKKEFVDIQMGSVKLHTWVEFPEGDGKAPIVLVMQHGPGMDDWQRALADQLALQGFIAIAPDLHSGLGPNGGNYDSFGGTDEVMRATARVNADEQQARYKAAYEWGKKLPRWNGKVASIGFCMGGGNSFRFATETPELAAAVVYYGGTPRKEALANLKAPVLAFYGEDDARVTAAAEPTAETMKELGKSFEFHVYPHATHGFLEYQDLAGNPNATSDSWSRTIAFLKSRTM